MLDHWKPLGGFIENTIRPLIDEMKWFLEELEKKGIKIEEKNIKGIVSHIFICHLRTVCVQAVQSVVITGIVAYTLCKIYR